MLGDYLQYNWGPVDWSKQPGKTEKTKVELRNNSESESIPDFATAPEHEDGYDPYNHPIDRKILEKHVEKKRY